MLGAAAGGRRPLLGVRRDGVTRAAAVMATVGTLAAGGCAGSGTVRVPTDRPTEADVRQVAAQAGQAVFYLGPRFAGLPLTGANGGPGGVTFIYGTCEIALPAEGGCAPPVQVQNLPFRAGNWRSAVGCYGLPPVRGLPAARHDGLVLFTDAGLVKIYARNRGEDLRAVRALVPAGGRAELRPAAPAVLRIVSNQCGGAELRSS